MVDKIKDFFRNFILTKSAFQDNNDDRGEQSLVKSDQNNEKGDTMPENVINGSVGSGGIPRVSSMQQVASNKLHSKADSTYTHSRDALSVMQLSFAINDHKAPSGSSVLSAALKAGHYLTTDTFDRTLRWDVVLYKLYQLIREALRTTCLISSAGSPLTRSMKNNPGRMTTMNSNLQTDSIAFDHENNFYIPSAQMHAVVEMLKQMGTREIQLQIFRYYRSGITCSGRMHENSAKACNSNRIGINETERMELLNNCRRALLDCWKFALDQLNQFTFRLYEHDREDIVYLYYELICHVAERCEFHPPGHFEYQKDSHDANGNEVEAHRDIDEVNQLREASSEIGSVKPHDQVPKIIRKGSTCTSPKDETAESDIDAYRWSLVATFHHVAETIEYTKQHKRPGRNWISIKEAQFSSKMIAIAFVRIPSVQMVILEHISLAVKQKEWSLDRNEASNTPQGTKSSRRRHSSGSNSNDLQKFLQEWSGCADNFKKCGRSKKAHGRSLDGVDENQDSYIPNSAPNDMKNLRKCASMDTDTLSLVHSSDTFKFLNVGVRKRSLSPRKASRQERIVDNTHAFTADPLASKAWEQEFPALFGWTMYKPYLASSLDVELYSIPSLQGQDFPSWLDKITHDGEFFAWFMSSYFEHLAISSYSVKYPSAFRPIPWTALPGYALLVKTLLLLVREAAWEQWQMTCRSYEDDLKAFVNETPCVSLFFALSRRGITTVLDQVHHWLGVNPGLLDPCVLALLECTNAYSIKSVSQCLSNLEKWFSAAAIPRKYPSNKISTSLWRLPTSFQGLKFVYAVRRLVSSENFEILKRVLLFLYRRMDYFEDTLRQQTLKILIQRHMSLFLHWNYEVRRYYHHLLVFRVARVSRTALKSSTDYLLVRKDFDGLSCFDSRFLLPFDTRLNGSVSVTSCYDDCVTNSADDSMAANSPPEIQELLKKTNLKQLWTRSDLKWLRREQAFWRAFDACIATICCDERKRAHERNQQFQQEQEAIHIRSLSFHKLHTNPDTSFKINSVHEGLPGAKLGCGQQEVDRLSRALCRQPPYYLRYLPTEHVGYLQELKRLASHFKYPDNLQVYAPTSLREYSDTLTSYFQEFNRYGVVEATPLEFC